MSIFANLTKACVGVVASPVMLVADLLTLPSSAYDNKPAFGRTAKTLNAAGDCLAAAIKPKQEQS